MVLFLPQAEFMGWWSRVKLAETPHTSDLLETVLHSVPAAVGCAAPEVGLWIIVFEAAWVWGGGVSDPKWGWPKLLSPGWNTCCILASFINSNLLWTKTWTQLQEDYRSIFSLKNNIIISFFWYCFYTPENLPSSPAGILPTLFKPISSCLVPSESQ